MRKEDLNAVVNQYFPRAVLYSEDENTLTYLIVDHYPDVSERFSKIYEVMTREGHYPLLVKEGEDTVLKVTKKASRRGFSGKIVFALFAVTIASVMYTGYLSVQAYNKVLGLVGSTTSYGSTGFNVILFTLAVLTPLFLHELGHYIEARRGRVPSSFPFPIPAPVVSPLGTFGAIMLMRYLPKSLRDLLKLGLSGPLVGVSLSIVVFGLSYSFSPTIPMSAVQAGVSKGLLAPVSVAPLSALIISQLRPSPEGFTTLMNPAAEAAYLILLIHFANLLPIGQLDGGHVFRALTSMRTHYWASIGVSALAIIYSFVAPSMGWLAFFVVLAWILSGMRPHLGTANLLSSLDNREKAKYAGIYVLLLVLTFPVIT
ncbi:MAG: site-2 protease family protein [Desulfurococcales archaeon]|nr:site-2 protease family protein [Desulfurococcales archaeon]